PVDHVGAARHVERGHPGRLGGGHPRRAPGYGAKGIQPFSASGQQGWPLTRLISGYLYRSLGPDALKDVADGKARLTDPGYVKAAQ
ncbi:hypothetical protein ABZ372_14690, partial [Streptomyces sp. NPDC005921]